MKHKGRRNKKKGRKNHLQCYYDFVIWFAYRTPWRRPDEVIGQWKGVLRKTEGTLFRDPLFKKIDIEVNNLVLYNSIKCVDKFIGTIRHHCGYYCRIKMKNKGERT